MLRCYEPAHIAGVSKTAYVPATPRCLQWRRDLQRASTNSAPPDPDSQDAASPACSSSSGRSPRPSAPSRRRRSSSTASSPSTAPRLVDRSASTLPQRAPWCARRGRRRRPRRHDGLRRRGSGRRQARSGAPRRPAPGRDRCRGRRRRVRRRQRLAFPGVPGAAPPRGGLEVRLGGGSRPMGRHPQHVCARVGGRGRHRALRCRGVAVRARRRVRAVPDLRQRALALRTAPGGRRSRLPCHVRRPDARSKDAAVTNTLTARWPPLPWSP